MNPDLARRRRALFVYFFLPGLSLASWVTRTPEIRDAVGASVAQMGMVLFGMSIGSMGGILLSGRMVGRFGTRFGTVLGLSFVFASLLTIAAGTVLGLQWLVGIGLGFFGFGMGSAEIAINLDGAEVERRMGRAVLHTLHGCFSLGTLVGAVLGLGVIAAGVPVWVHLVTVAALVIVLILRFSPDIPAGQGIGLRSQTGAAGGTIWLDPRVLVIGAIVFAMALAEGSANDWLPILMVDEHGFSSASGSLIFVAFAAAMTVGRLGGGMVIDRLGPVAVLRCCAVLGAAGIGYVVFGNDPWLAGAAVFLWGIGASLGFPIALSAASSGGPGAAARVEAVAIVGYIAMLVGPPSLGFVGEAYGLRSAMLIVMVLVALAVFLAPMVRAGRATTHA